MCVPHKIPSGKITFDGFPLPGSVHTHSASSRICMFAVCWMNKGDYWTQFGCWVVTNISHSSAGLFMMDRPSWERLLVLSLGSFQKPHPWPGKKASHSTRLQGLCYPLGHRPHGITCFAFLSVGKLAPLIHSLPSSLTSWGAVTLLWLLLRSLWGKLTKNSRKNCFR